MGGEQQLKALIRQAFAENNVSDRAVLDVDALLGAVMLKVRRLVETLPDENLLRGRAWRDLEPIIKVEMEPYSQALRQSITRQEIIAGPELQAYAARQLEATGRPLIAVGGPTPPNVVKQVNRAVIGNARFEQLFAAKDGVSPYTRSMFRVVNRKVQAGIIGGMTTQAIADEVVNETISRGVPGVSLRGNTSVRTIRAQSMAMARTVTADVSRQVREKVYADNREAMEGMAFQFSSALDSRTCQTCATYDGQRWNKESDAPKTPIHPNCRCQVLAIDPEDPFWDEQSRTGQQLSRNPYVYKGKPINKLSKTDKAAARAKGHYVTKTQGKSRTRYFDGSTSAETFHRKAVEFEGDSFSDYLVSSNQTTQAEFFGGGKPPSAKNPRGGIGYRRAQYFRDQLNKFNKDPRDILVSMLNGPAHARRFIPIP